MIIHAPPIVGQGPRSFCDEFGTDGNHSVRVWDVARQPPSIGRVLYEFVFEDAAQSRASWNADESAILTWNERAGARVWNSQTGNLLYHIEPESGFVYAAWNPDGDRLLTLRLEKSPADRKSPLLAEIWRSGERLRAWSLPGFRRSFLSQWSADGTTLIYITDTIESDPETVTAYRWQVENAGPMTVTSLGKPPYVTPDAYTMDISADLSRLWFSDEFSGELQVWDVEQGLWITTVQYPGVGGLWLNEDESRLLTWSMQAAQSRDSQTLTLLTEWNYVGDPLLNVFQAYWINKSNEAVIIADRTWRWDTDLNKVEPVLCPAVWCGFPAWNATETRVALGTNQPLGIQVLQGTSLTPLFDLSTPVQPHFTEDKTIGIEWSPDGSRMLAYQGDSIFLWNIDQ